MKIFIKRNNSFSFALDVNLMDTINDIKNKIQQMIRIPNSQQCLIFQNRITKNWLKLQDYSVENHSTFNLILFGYTNINDEKMVEEQKNKEPQAKNKQPIIPESTPIKQAEVRIANAINDVFEEAESPPFELFIPTAVFHFDADIESVDFEKLNDIIKGDAVIVGIERGSLLLKLAFIGSLKNNINTSFQNVKSKLCGTLGKQIVGNLIGEPELKKPDESKIKELLSNPSMNLFQNSEELEQVDLNNIIKQVEQQAEDVSKSFVNTIVNQKEDYEKAEEMIHDEINNNQYEMVIVAQTIIANKYVSKYQEIKNKIDSSNANEFMLYHGSQLGNHFGIIDTGFKVPQASGCHGALFGLGVYATSNLFYACRYANGNNKMKINQRVPILLCKAIYNKKKIVNISCPNYNYRDKPASDDVKSNYGVNHALVGRTRSWRTCDPNSSEAHIIADEYIFPNKDQLIPIWSFTILRPDHYVLWKDEHIDNDDNKSYFKKVNKEIQVNMYGKKTVQEALDFIRLKIRNRVKLITNGGDEYTGRDLIKRAREIVGSNFICLVFSSHTKHCEWICETENVLYTNYINMFHKFSLLKMDESSILGFISELEKLQNLKFKINKSEMLRFPKAEFDT